MKNIDKTLDTAFSIYIRLKYTDENARGNCFTCDDPYTFNLLQCGHFSKRGNTLFRHDKDNARVQCKDCNEFKSGNMEIYEERLINEIGMVRVAEIKFKSKQPFAGWSKFEKRLILEKLRKECRTLLLDKNFQVQIP